MINGIVINKDKLGKKVGYIVKNEQDLLNNEYKNIVIAYENNSPILIKTNLSQNQWNDFCNGQLSKQELEKYI